MAHVSRIKQALGDRARVTVDVNQAWNEADAAGAIARLEAADVLALKISKSGGIHVELPDGLGLGLTLDEDKLSFYRRDR